MKMKAHGLAFESDDGLEVGGRHISQMPCGEICFQAAAQGNQLYSMLNAGCCFGPCLETTLPILWNIACFKHCIPHATILIHHEQSQLAFESNARHISQFQMPAVFHTIYL